LRDTRATAEKAAEALGVDADEVAVASTGLIGLRRGERSGLNTADVGLRAHAMPPPGQGSRLISPAVSRLYVHALCPNDFRTRSRISAG
jgi:hypothetical protein